MSFLMLKKGLCLKLRDKNAHCFILPIPYNELKKQVWDEGHPVEKVIPKPHFCIEHVFWPFVDQTKWFKNDHAGNMIFKGDKYKIKFSKEIVPSLEAMCFESFRPIFNFIKVKC